MSTTSGPFENIQNQPVPNPFSPAKNLETAVASPFAPAPVQNSPFRNDAESRPGGKIPERRKPFSPFDLSDDEDGFGFEPSPTSPFAVAPEAAPPASPFAVAPPEANMSLPPRFSQPPFADAPPQPVPAAPVEPPVQQQIPAAPPFQPSAPIIDQPSDSYSIRQLELRAIFGMDREMTPDEIMQRARALPGVRHIARVRAQDVPIIDALKQVVANLGFSGNVKLQTDSQPIEFIRETGILLAVQTDGGFQPGIRETLMIIARELSRTA